MSPMPGDDGSAVRLRASDADREHAAGLLGSVTIRHAEAKADDD
jgi:hypothetical protein